MTARSVHGLLQLCEEALAHPTAERDAFLDQQCAGDADLRRAVAALLAEEPVTAGFLQAPAWTPERLRLAPGTRLGPYEIQSLIGLGGMGEVYKARDTRLGRTVAIKLLPADLAGNGDRRQRLEQEARSLSALNHPHICTLYDVSEHRSTGSGQASLFLVMEYLAGETLAERLVKGALPIAQALTIGVEITEALAAAHRQGIIHRDLKPANVMLTKSGAKLLDFGLAKLTGHAGAAAVHPVSSLLTAEGTIAGTLHYMAPQQLEGSAADARTDIWAVGAILYEMIAGRHAFDGTSAAGLMGAILEREVEPLAARQPLTPPGLDHLVQQCLAKQPDDRPDTAHDLANELRRIVESTGGALPSVRRKPRRSRMTRAAALIMMCVAGSAALTSWVWARWRPVFSPPPVVRMEFSATPADEVKSSVGECEPTGGVTTALTWTPDGRSLVFVGQRDGVQGLYVREIGEPEARPLDGTEGAQMPVVSSDGQWVAFWAASALKKVALNGGPAMELASGVDAPTALLWDGRGRMFFGAAASGIWQMPAGGGPTRLTTPSDTERGHIPSSMLPGDLGILYTARKRLLTWGDEEVVALDFDTGHRKLLLKNAADARYVSTGHLVFMRLGQLFAVRFDAKRLEVEGEPVPVLKDVAQTLTAANENSGTGQFAIAAGGALAWIQSPVATVCDSRIVTVDQTGRVSPLGPPPRKYGAGLRVSPDGRQLAVTIRSLTEVGLWLYDLDRVGRLKPLRRTGEAYWPLWSRDGRSVMFQGLAEGRFSLESWSADESAPPVVRVTPDWSPSSWTGDGQLVAAGPTDLVVGSFDKGHDAFRRVSQSGEIAAWPEISPDGRWLAYGSKASGRFEIYVQPYPGQAGGVPVSLEGGESPVWHPDGRELFYVSAPDPAGERRMMVVAFEPGARPHFGTPRGLFHFAQNDFAFTGCPVRSYDLAPDGKRFYVFQRAAAPAAPVVTHIEIVLNWLTDLQATLPGARGN